MLITFIMNEVHYEYDIRGLLMAFYPGCHIQGHLAQSVQDVLTPIEAKIVTEATKNTASVFSYRVEQSNSQSEKLLEADLYLLVAYGEQSITLWTYQNTGKMESVVIALSWEDKDAKNELKRQVYHLLSHTCENKTLPWGTLTGIRPVKLPMALLEEGQNDKQICKHMKQTYLLSQEKANLSLQIAHKELELLQCLDYEDGYSMYIGIPFCPTTCLYCSFTSYPYQKWEARIEEYLNALEQEILYTAEQFKGKKLNTIYFGGGTPTTLSPEHLDRLLACIMQHFDLSNLKEWTVEGGRPDSITLEKLQVLRKYPVDRISINPQTMKQETLDIIGRRHTIEQVKEAFYMAREVGFMNINMDLILGLPGEHIEDVIHTMEEIMVLNPDNLTVHTLALKRASKLNINKEQYADLYLERNTEAMMQVTADYAEKMNMKPYYLYRQKNMSGNLENIGYAKAGKEGIYNILIMEERQSILALGAGAVTKSVQKDKIERASNVKDIEQYISRIDEMIDRKRKLFSV